MPMILLGMFPIIQYSTPTNPTKGDGNAARKFCGNSLNDMLPARPDILANLMGILSRFRESLIAISADIDQMFPQVEVKPRARAFLRFL